MQPPPPQLALWVQHAQALGPTVVAIIAAAIAGYIALRQWWTAHDRLRLDVYDRRFAVYEATKNLISAATLQGQATPDDLAGFYDGIRGAEFLFDGDTRNFLMKIGDMAARARIIRARLDRHPEHPHAGQLIDQEEDILDFLREQAPHLEALFGRYLDMSQIGLLRGVGLRRPVRS
jgi:hypothetical protein